MKGKWAGWVLVVDTFTILATDGLGFGGMGQTIFGMAVLGGDRACLPLFPVSRWEYPAGGYASRHFGHSL